MKKFMSAILAFLIAFIPIIGNTTEQKTADIRLIENIEDRVKVLNGLNITGYKDISLSTGVKTGGGMESYELFKDEVKSSFVTYVCNIYGDYGYSVKDCDKAIAIAESAGIIHSGQTDLDKPLYYDEAITMLVRLLGFETYAQYSGGYPTGYRTIAKRLKLDSGVTTSGDIRLQCADVVNLLYNAINCKCADIESISSTDGAIWSTSNDETVLYKYRKIYRVDGVIESVGKSSIYPETDTEGDQVVIDGYKYESNKNLEALLGMNVESYIREVSNGDDEVVLATAKDNKVLEIESDSVDSVSDDLKSLSYWNLKDEKKTVSISPIASMIYNGRAQSVSKDMFLPKDGEIRLIDNGRDSGYNVVFINSYNIVVADDVSIKNKNVTNKYTFDKDNSILDLYDADNCIVKIYDGNTELELSDISTGDILRVIQTTTNGENYTKIYRSRKIVEGTPTTVYSDKNTVYIGDVEYKYTDGYIDAIKGKDTKALGIEVGKPYKFYLDDRGKIAYVQDNKTGGYYGIPYAVSKPATVIDDDVQIKMFTSDGEWQVYDLAEKIELNGKRSNETDAIPVIQCAKDGNLDVISYDLNDDGEINKIDIAKEYDDGNDGDYNVYKAGKHRWRINNSFESLLFIENNTIIFDVDTEKLADENSYSIGSATSFSLGSTYDMVGYDVDEYLFAKVAISKTMSTTTESKINSADFLVVDYIEDVIDSEGSAAKRIIGATSKHAALTYYCDDESLISGIKQGDIISARVNKKGYMQAVKKWRSVEDTGLVYEDLDKNPAFICGKLKKLDVSGARMRLDCGSNVCTVRLPSSISVVVYDKESKKVERGEYNDMFGAEYVMVKLVHSSVSSVIVYK